MTDIERVIGELEQASYYVGFYTGQGVEGRPYLREAGKQEAEARRRLLALVAELEAVKP